MAQVSRPLLILASWLDVLVWLSLVLVISPQAMALLRWTEAHPWMVTTELASLKSRADKKLCWRVPMYR